MKKDKKDKKDIKKKKIVVSPTITEKFGVTKSAKIIMG